MYETTGMVAVGIRKNASGEIETFGMETNLSDNQVLKERIQARWGFYPEKVVLMKGEDALVVD